MRQLLVGSVFHAKNFEWHVMREIYRGSRVRGLCLYMAALGFFSSHSYAYEAIDLPSLFKAISSEALKGEQAPSAEEVWARLEASGSAQNRTIEWKDAGRVWLSSVSSYADRSNGVNLSVEIQSLKINGKDKARLPVELVSIKLDSGQVCVDPRTYMDKGIKYEIVPISMHDATYFAYVGRYGARYSSILSAGMPYKSVGCAEELNLKF